MAATDSLWKPRDGPLVYLEAVTYTQNTTPNMRRSRGGPGCFTKTTESYRPQSQNKTHTDVPIRIFHGIVIRPMPGMLIVSTNWGVDPGPMESLVPAPKLLVPGPPG